MSGVMTQALRDAAQALVPYEAGLEEGESYDAEDVHDMLDDAHAHYESQLQQRAALSAPQPTADERVAELMRAVDTLEKEAWWWGESCGEDHVSMDDDGDSHNTALRHRSLTAKHFVEQSARALLSASQEDAEHAAMYRWLRDQHEGSDPAESFSVFCPGQVYCLEPVGSMPGELDAAIRSAMKEKKA